MEERRVVITGTGVISPVGNGTEAFWSALKAGRCGISAYPEAKEWNLPVHVAGAVRDFDPTAYGISLKETKRNDRFCLLAQAAAEQAMQESGLQAGTNIAPHKTTMANICFKWFIIFNFQFSIFNYGTGS